MLRRYGLDRQSGGEARQADDAVTPECPGTRRPAFRPGASRPVGCPAGVSEGEVPNATAAEPEQLFLL